MCQLGWTNHPKIAKTAVNKGVWRRRCGSRRGEKKRLWTPLGLKLSNLGSGSYPILFLVSILIIGYIVVLGTLRTSLNPADPEIFRIKDRKDSRKIV